ncbi:MAG: anthranilate synthase component I [Pseudomonadota bacterium]
MIAPAPGLDAFREAYDRGEAQIVWTRRVSDLETPVSAYLKLAGDLRNAFLLESVEGGETLGRYSIIGLDPDLVWRAEGGRATIIEDGAERTDDLAPLESFRRLEAASRIEMPADTPPMAAGLFGYFGYETAGWFERLPAPKAKPVDAPDAYFIRPRLIAVFDAVKQEIVLVTPVRPQAGVTADIAYDGAAARLAKAVAALEQPLSGVAAPGLDFAPTDIPPPVSNLTPDSYGGLVRRAKEYIRAGDIFQAVLSQRFETPFRESPLGLYRALRRLNPSPFMFLLNLEVGALVGSSPEILVRVRGGEITIRPIAGTRCRGADRTADAALEADLLADPKERAEHLMLLDLGRNDVGRSAAYGSVEVTEQFVVERYSHVMHIVSNVVGRLRDDRDALEAVFGGFPAGTVSGAPKIRAMEIIHELEPQARGPYGGAIGYFSATGDVDTCIALRTGFLKDGVLTVQAGAGVVADSDPASEHQECVDKSKALLAAAAAAQSGANR